MGRLLLTVLAVLAASCAAPAAPQPGKGSRLLIIGIDGADWDRLQPMMEHGRLPHVAALVERGAVGSMGAERPPLSPMLWTTAATGQLPDQHGILGFREWDEGAARAVPVSGRGRQAKALWNMADDSGLSSAVVGWWATWPAEEIAGVMISDLWASSQGGEVVPADATVFPPEMRRELDALKVDAAGLGLREMRRFLPHGANPAGLPAADDGAVPPMEQLTRIVASTLSREAAALHLMKNRQPDLTMVFFPGIGATGHLFARYEGPPLPGVSPAERQAYEGVLDAFIRFQDEIIGRLVRAAGPDAAVMLLSDHGLARGAERPGSEPPDLTGRAALWNVGPGIIVLAGGPFAATPLGEVRLADVAPTALVALGLPVAEDLGGSPLTAALRAADLGAHPVATVTSYERLGRSVHRLDAGRGWGMGSGATPAAGQQSFGAQHQVNLATVLVDQERLWEARAAYERALQLDPDSVLARRGYFDLLARQEHKDAARAAAAALLELAPATESYAAVARFWIESDQIEAGRLLLAGLSGDGPGEHLARGLLDLAEGRHEAAEKGLAAALQRQPGSWEAAEALFHLMEEQGRLPEAIPVLRQGLAAHGGNSVPHLLALGFIALSENKLDAAADYLGRAEEEAPDEVEVQLYLGSVYYRTGRNQDAVQAFGRVLQADPSNLEARRYQILALGRSGRVAQALAAFRAAGPEGRGEPELLNAAAYACILNGMAAEGGPLVQRSLEIDPGRGETLELAETLRREGHAGGIR